MTETKSSPNDNYADFLAGKTPRPPSFGREPDELNEILYPFQCAITNWAIRRGRAAVFADCGLGKTFIQLEWARQSGRKVLIVAPLNVAEQTIEEAKKIDLEVVRVNLFGLLNGLLCDVQWSYN